MKYQRPRVFPGPDRIYFDIEEARKINSALMRKPIDVESPFLKTRARRAVSNQRRARRSGN